MSDYVEPMDTSQEDRQTKKPLSLFIIFSFVVGAFFFVIAVSAGVMGSISDGSSPSQNKGNSENNWISVTSIPTPQSSKVPSLSPTYHPSPNPSSNPSSNPSQNPTSKPSFNPISSPSSKPSISPTTEASLNPTSRPSTSPSKLSSLNPSLNPSSNPSTSNPTSAPTSKPTSAPIVTVVTTPISSPISITTSFPLSPPIFTPTSIPTNQPTINPTAVQTSAPTVILILELHDEKSDTVACPLKKPNVICASIYDPVDCSSSSINIACRYPNFCSAVNAGFLNDQCKKVKANTPIKDPTMTPTKAITLDTDNDGITPLKCPQQNTKVICPKNYDPVDCSSSTVGSCEYSNICIATGAGFSNNQCTKTKTRTPTIDPTIAQTITPTIAPTIALTVTPTKAITLDTDSDGITPLKCPQQNTKVICPENYDPVDCSSSTVGSCEYSNICIATGAGFSNDQCQPVTTNTPIKVPTLVPIESLP